MSTITQTMDRDQHQRGQGQDSDSPNNRGMRQSVVVLQRAFTNLDADTGAVLLRLSEFVRGADSVLVRVPEAPGVYAWYRDVKIDPSSPEALFQSLIAEIESPKFLPRTSSIPPVYEVSIRSLTTMSNGKKALLRRELEDPSFRAQLLTAISTAIMFQAPLYIGKTKNLRRRVKQHLKPFSTLGQRLDSVGISLMQSNLLLIPVSSTSDQDSGGTLSPSVEETTDPTDSEQESDAETLFEEVFSKLFTPNFTVRYG